MATTDHMRDWHLARAHDLLDTLEQLATDDHSALRLAVLLGEAGSVIKGLIEAATPTTTDAEGNHPAQNGATA